MDLLIDIGNTNLKWATSHSGALGEMRTVRHYAGLPIDLHADWEQLEPPERILVANVAGDKMVGALGRTCRAYWGVDPSHVRTEPSAHGVRIAYDRPDRFGVDRWLALLGAHHGCPGPVLVVDAGTAITCDLLLADGRHLGGLVLPGVEMMRDSLLAGTHIPRVEPEELAEPWAADTATAVAAGSVQAPAALVERLCERLEEQAGTAPELIVTGGDAERLLPAVRRRARHQPDLVLRGLALLA